MVAVRHASTDSAAGVVGSLTSGLGSSGLVASGGSGTANVPGKSTLSSPSSRHLLEGGAGKGERHHHHPHHHAHSGGSSSSGSHHTIGHHGASGGVLTPATKDKSLRAIRQVLRRDGNGHGGAAGDPSEGSGGEHSQSARLLGSTASTLLSGSAAGGEDEDDEEEEEEDEGEDGGGLSSKQLTIKATALLLVGLGLVTLFSDPMVSARGER